MENNKTQSEEEVEIRPSTQEAINHLQKFKEAVNVANEESKKEHDNPNYDAGDEEDPSIIMFDNIADNCIDLLQTPEIAKAMNNIADIITPSLGQENADRITSDICTIVAVMITNTAFGAISAYDKQLADALNDRFRGYNTAISNLGATVNGQKGAVSVINERVEECRQKLGLVKIQPDVETESE